MQNHMTKPVFRNSKILHFLGVKSEIYQSLRHLNFKLVHIFIEGQVWNQSSESPYTDMIYDAQQAKKLIC